jgi:hypothetical protein
MKTLKFEHKYVNDILEGKKTNTWRLFDDKNLERNDELELVDSETKEIFAKATIENVEEKKIADFSEIDLKDHGYENVDAMLESHRKYYGDKVNLETLVKIIRFRLT